jgi:hypothetical protein
MLWPFSVVCVRLVYFFPFWYFWDKKNLATLALIHCGEVVKHFVGPHYKTFSHREKNALFREKVHSLRYTLQAVKMYERNS